jgi:CO dehydrogenase/acetyl-CoA synthase beta subunit
MILFEDVIRELRAWMDGMRDTAPLYHEQGAFTAEWPAGERGNIVLQADTGVELGNPRDESASFMVWTLDQSLVRDGIITRVGPDVQGYPGGRLPLGKAVLLAVDGFTRDNCYERHREIELARHDLNLKGYMVRAVSQYMREWSRISVEAMADGFSLELLSSALINRYRKLDYVRAVEVLLVTSSPGDVRALRLIGERAARLVAAMNKMAQELSFNCDTCEYTDVCGEVDALKSMRQSMKRESLHG